MNRSMTTALNTMNQLQKQFDIISHNVSNAQTTGFKSRDVSFSDLLVQEVRNQSTIDREVGRLSPLGIRQGNGAKIAKAAIILKQGALQQTGRTLDIAFTKPEHFLKVQVGEEVQFTRNGALYLTPAEGDNVMLVTQDGHPVLDEENNAIIFSNQLTQYRINEQGIFEASGDNLVNTFALGVISVNNPQFMEQKGNNLIGLPQDVEVEIEQIYVDAVRDEVGIEQRMLESSNVDLGKELTNMLMVQRALQFQSRAISISDQMLGIVNNIR